MRRAFALALCVLAVAGPAQASSWQTVHDRTIRRHDLEQNWGKEAGAQSPGSFFYQEYRIEVVEEAREDWVETIPAPVISSGVSLQQVHPVGEIQKLICSYDWECSIALGVAGCESGFNPYSDNPTSSAFGIFQVLGETATDPATQIAHAYGMYLARGWQPWGLGESWGCYF